jgi:cytoskeletal protein CcmA (bactofilin family)
MFGRKKDDEDDEAGIGIPTESETVAAAKSGVKATLPQRARPAPYPAKPEVVRRTADYATPRNGHNGNGSHGEPKRLIVGRDIVLTGAISSCDKLIVEGRVEANLTDCREIEIAETGTFRGEASVEVAEVSGRFEGTLIARELLLVRAKGCVVGTVRFARIEIERGGEIEGQVSVLPVEPSTVVHLASGNGAAIPASAAVHEEAVHS